MNNKDLFTVECHAKLLREVSECMQGGAAHTQLLGRRLSSGSLALHLLQEAQPLSLVKGSQHHSIPERRATAGNTEN
ncbi:hypothetical protein E2C01_030902 [Portunus trituberculatus]|uniref:Uncharacterized protein n=1 Tax=Portunus trituberculatus TaxID=210409 RepID=A0A5B7EYM3_PORTR|nr:hypothetical protein [Portunus trituberculatus]